MDNMDNDLRQLQKKAEEFIANTLAIIPEVIEMPKMSFCVELGTVLSKSGETIYDYMHRKYLPNDYNSDEIRSAIDTAVSNYIHANKKNDDDSSSQKTAVVKENWEKYKTIILLLLKAQFIALDFTRALNVVNQYLSSQENQSRVIISKFLSQDWSKVEDFGNNQDIKNLLMSLQSSMRYFPSIGKIGVSTEEAETYLKLAALVKDIKLHAI